MTLAAERGARYLYLVRENRYADFMAGGYVFSGHVSSASRLLIEVGSGRELLRTEGEGEHYFWAPFLANGFANRFTGTFCNGGAAAVAYGRVVGSSESKSADARFSAYLLAVDFHNQDPLAANRFRAPAP